MTWKVAAFYRFIPLENLPALQAKVQQACADHGICGTILLAPEGVNGTIAGQGGALERIVTYLDGLLGIRQGELKFSGAAEKPFQRLKVRLKKEIITLKAPETNPAARTGLHVDPRDWNDLISDPGVIVIDTRNTYEVDAGKFQNAVDPKLGTFSEFKDFATQNLDPARHRKIAMYCTGGIRCEKASSYLLARGFAEIYQLKGGILKYLETVPAEKSLWRGDCFVFDERRALGHDLQEKEKRPAVAGRASS